LFYYLTPAVYFQSLTVLCAVLDISCLPSHLVCKCQLTVLFYAVCMHSNDSHFITVFRLKTSIRWPRFWARSSAWINCLHWLERISRLRSTKLIDYATLYCSGRLTYLLIFDIHILNEIIIIIIIYFICFLFPLFSTVPNDNQNKSNAIIVFNKLHFAINQPAFRSSSVLKSCT